MMNSPLPTPTPPKPPAPASGGAPQTAPSSPQGGSNQQIQKMANTPKTGLVEAGTHPALVSAPNQPQKIGPGENKQKADQKEPVTPPKTNQAPTVPVNQPAVKMAAASAHPTSSSNQATTQPASPKAPTLPRPPMPAAGQPSGQRPPTPTMPGGQPKVNQPKTNPLPSPKPQVGGGKSGSSLPPMPNTPPQPVTSGSVQPPKPLSSPVAQPPMPPKPPVMPPKPPAMPAAGPVSPTQLSTPPANPIITQPPRPGVPVPPKPGVPVPPKPGAVPPTPPIAVQPPKPLSPPTGGVASPTMPPRPAGPPGPPVPPPAPSQPPVPPTGGAGTPPVPPAPPAKPTTPAARFASIRQSPFKLLPIILGALALIGVIIFAITRLLGGSARQPAGSSTTTPSTGGNAAGNRTVVPAQQTTLVYWGLWEPSEVLTEVFDEFEAANPGIQVEYTKQSHLDYRERLQTAIASGKGPDLYRFHASWTPMLKNELAPVPTSIISAADFQKIFYPVAYKQLQVNGQLVGVPLMYDGLALYYNKEMLKNANAQPPQTWAELRTLATQLTIRSGETIQRGGLAIGNASNVEHFSDIIALLMLQNGANLTQPTSAEARDALLFYTNFAKVDKVWGETLPSSTIAFARGDVAMMFAPSWRVHEIQAQNPNLDFGIASLPKLGDNKVTWATYWAEGVNAQSKNKDAAWKLLQYLSSSAVMKKMYSDQSEVRTFGEPYARVDLANDLASQPLVAPYLADAPTADGWYLSSYTHDNGINDQLIKYYQDAVNAVLSGKKIEDVLTTLNQGTAQVLRQYGVTITSSGGGGTP